jgi:polysaccharide biosynthesis protein PelF
MEVALIGEGTYPHQFGGVSVWCDQIVRGLPDHDFRLVALVATGGEPVRWPLPDNVTSVTAVPLWGRPPAVSALAPRGRRAHTSRGALRVLGELLESLLAPPPEQQDRFAAALQELFELAQRSSLAAILGSEDAVALLSTTWRGWCPDGTPAAPALGDAVTALQLLEHALRPLSHPPVRADVSHTVTNGLGVLPALAARWQFGTPIVITEHGMYMREQYLHSRNPPYRWPARVLHLRFMRRLCALGYREAEMITPGNVYNMRWEKRLGADLSRVRTVYNGVDPAGFAAIDGEPAAPTISWVGRIDPVKDLETLLEAFSLVHAQMPEARLRMFGSAPPGQEGYLSRCRALAARLGLSQAATFEGRVDEIRDAYEAGQVVVLCSITEGFPYTLIEAMTCGRPCVATDVGGVTEALSDTGVVVPAGSPGDLAQACLTLLGDRATRQRLGAAARTRALELFTVDRSIRAFDEIYTSVTAGNGPPELPVSSDSGELLGAAG